MYSQSYVYRLVFNKSSCPLRYETDPEGAPESLCLALAKYRELSRPLSVPSEAKST